MKYERYKKMKYYPEKILLVIAAFLCDIVWLSNCEAK